MRGRLIAYANAKLNLALDITGLREDGYHLMDMVMQSVTLHDTLFFDKAAPAGIRITSNSRYLPTDGRNAVWKAAEKLATFAGIEPRCSVRIEKRIPTQAGMGGGSADAAAALVALNRLWGLGLSERTLCSIGAGVGADVPFCIVGGTARVRGIGEIIEKRKSFSGCSFVIIMPRCGNPTREIFSRYDALGPPTVRPDPDRLLHAIEKRDIDGVAASLCNVLTEVCGDEPRRLERLLLKNGALGACMTGSGAAVFGIFRSRKSAEDCRNALAAEDLRVYLASPCRRGVRLFEDTNFQK